MVLSVESAEADRLARKLAETTGETITEAVVASLRERLEREERKRRQDREDFIAGALAIGRRSAARPVLDGRSLEDMLYNRHGEPE